MREGSPCRTQVSILLIPCGGTHKSEPSEILTTTLSLSKGKGRMTIYTVLRPSCSSFVADSQNANFKGVSKAFDEPKWKNPFFFPSRGSLPQPSAYKPTTTGDSIFVVYQLKNDRLLFLVDFELMRSKPSQQDLHGASEGISRKET